MDRRSTDQAQDPGLRRRYRQWTALGGTGLISGEQTKGGDMEERSCAVSFQGGSNAYSPSTSETDMFHLMIKYLPGDLFSVLFA